MVVHTSLGLSTKAHHVPGRQSLLLVDDYVGSLKALTAVFQEDYNVWVADNPQDAIDIAFQEDVDLILLDVDMPGMSGYDVCRVLKNNERTEDIPVIFVTGLTSLEEESKGLELGAVDYITKPYHLGIIKARIRNHMELVRYRKELNQISRTDELTKLPNRRQFDTMLSREWHSAVRGQHNLALLFIDIDNFKAYNDMYGHLAGDACLQAVAMALESCRRRENDFLARYGGEEFVAILPNSSEQGAVKIANGMLEAVRTLAIAHAGNSSLHIVTVSIGIACSRPDGEKCDAHQCCTDLIRRADQQLYKAKRAGKNRIMLDPCPPRPQEPTTTRRNSQGADQASHIN